MINYRDFIKRIQEKIGEIHAADGIVESLWWDHVLREVNDISIEFKTTAKKNQVHLNTRSPLVLSSTR